MPTHTQFAKTTTGYRNEVIKKYLSDFENKGLWVFLFRFVVIVVVVYIFLIPHCFANL